MFLKPRFIVSSDEEMSSELLEKFITEHQSYLFYYEKLKGMYEDDYEIFSYAKKERYKPDNRIAVNFARYIVNTFNGYFSGIPIKTSHEKEEVDEYLAFIDGYNNQDDNNSELSKLCSIYGHAYELIFNDEEGNIGLTYINPMECFVVYDNSIRKKPKFGVRYFINDDGEIEGTYSDENKIVYFDSSGGEIRFTEEEVHPFDGVPIIEYVENEERKGIVESVESLINAFNKAISEKANDVDYYADAYLVILGAELDNKMLENFRDKRTINVGDFEGENIEVKFLEKPNNDNTQENLLDRLERLIFQISMVANISERNFGDSSGVALRYKLQPMDNLATMKERKFTGSLNRRYKIIASYPGNVLSQDDWVNIKYVFSRKLPANLLEESNIAKNLKGIVSDETVVSGLSIVDNAKEEIERIEKEKEDKGQLFERVNFTDNREVSGYDENQKY